MSEILRPRLFDIDNEHPPPIAALPPLSPDADHKTSPVIGAELVSFAQGRAFAHQRLKLQIARAEADQPVINRRRVGRHLVMHHHQQIKVHLMLMEQVNAAQRSPTSRPAAFIRTMVVLQRFVAFEAQPDNKAMFAEQSAPWVVDQRPVGLQAVADSHAVGA